MMILLLLFLNIANAAEVKCKNVSVKYNCNTCTIERCTDGKKQWDSSWAECTAMMCDAPILPYDPADWPEDAKPKKKVKK